MRFLSMWGGKIANKEWDHEAAVAHRGSGRQPSLNCQKPFSLEGVDFKVDSRCKVILDLLKSELLLKNIK